MMATTAHAHTTARAAARPENAHLAAIHTLKALCGMSDDDYRALLQRLCGASSAKDITVQQRAKVREHLQLLAGRMGVGRFDQSWRYKSQTSPTERKVWALWYALGKAGRLNDPAPAALHHWVQRQVGVAHLRWTSEAQRQRLIEQLKSFLART